MASNEGVDVVASANWQAYQRARDSGHDDYLESAKKCDQFYLGEQWDERDKDKLEAEGRPALTINLVMKVVNAFLGKHASERVDLTLKPRRDATQDTAKGLTKLIEQLLDDNFYEFREKEVFQDGLVGDRGYFDVRMGFEDNIMGDVRIRAKDPFEVLPDPDAKSYDPSDWNSVVCTRWMTLDDVEAHYGKAKRDEVRSASQVHGSFGEDSIRYEGSRTFGADEFDPTGQHQAFDDLHQQDIRSVRVIERQYKKLTRIRYFVDNETGDMREIPEEIPDDRAATIAKQMGVSIISKVGKRIRWAVTADQVVLHDAWSPYRSFTVIPYFPYFHKGKSSGVVKQLLDPQEQFNKIESQMLHVVNTMANSGWTVEEGSLANMTIAELEERGAETGLVVSYRRGTEKPSKIEPNQIPSGLDRLSERARLALSDIPGTEGITNSRQRDISGVALDQLESIGLIQVQVPFDALKYTRWLLVRKVVELVQDFYTETRVLRVTLGDGMDEVEEEIILNGVDAAGDIINDMTIGEYDLVISQQPARDNYQDAQFAAALSMREAGVMVPDDVVIRASSLDNKHHIADRVARLMGTAEPTPEEQQIQQFMVQNQMRAAVAEVAKLEAQVEELQARAASQFAKAQSLAGEEQRMAIEQGAQYQLKLAELQSKLRMFYDDLSNKVRLANIHSQANLQETMYKEASQAATKELELRLRPPASAGSNQR